MVSLVWLGIALGRMGWVMFCADGALTQFAMGAERLYAISYQAQEKGIPCWSV
ncbi:hypothetical protein HA050_05000 [Iodobacter sp. HSC-16F04]|uniref:Uncharacterized protein n=1 Tax=Iodobacter violaceini TaxID=3044271 RepID=A0ABX0KNY0_9NEIS|nr:hypothetical protein [Iodobacter violacea]NHQ85472.1 hypothetical protein [Iodobacter violacea]